jgi:hypothetical protein
MVMIGALKTMLQVCRFGSDEDVRVTALQWFRQQSEEFFEHSQMGCNGWYINGIPASTTMGTIFNGLYSFTHNNPQTDFM